ncbi:hypothetical protein VTI28DRAFT_9314 [Corynascus sepedonium]
MPCRAFRLVTTKNGSIMSLAISTHMCACLTTATRPTNSSTTAPTGCSTCGGTRYAGGATPNFMVCSCFLPRRSI